MIPFASAAKPVKFALFIALASAVSDAAQITPECDGTGSDQSDYSSFLNIAIRPVKMPVEKTMPKMQGLVLAQEPTSLKSGSKKKAASGVIFVKMIKVAGELFAHILSQYAYQRGWRVLQNKVCSEDDNPMGQATCQCESHYIGPGELPPPPAPGQRYAALYTHMHYDHEALKDHIVPDAVRLTILRHPFDVLRSAHVMAAYQRLSGNAHDRKVQNSFCQDLAHDGDLWRSHCEMVWTGMDSLLDYLDRDANEALMLLLQNAQGQPEEVHKQALLIIDNVTNVLSNFTVGLQKSLDASLLMFEQVIGWPRHNTLYRVDPSVSHSYSDDAAAQAAFKSWGEGTPIEDEIKAKLRRGPYYYHELLYERGVQIHERQLHQILGPQEKVDAAVHEFKRQNKAFASCMKSTIKDHVPSCLYRGLRLNADARPHCANIALQEQEEE